MSARPAHLLTLKEFNILYETHDIERFDAMVKEHLTRDFDRSSVRGLYVKNSVSRGTTKLALFSAKAIARKPNKPEVTLFSPGLNENVLSGLAASLFASMTRTKIRHDFRGIALIDPDYLLNRLPNKKLPCTIKQLMDAFKAELTLKLKAAGVKPADIFEYDVLTSTSTKRTEKSASATGAKKRLRTSQTNTAGAGAGTSGDAPTAEPNLYQIADTMRFIPAPLPMPAPLPITPRSLPSTLEDCINAINEALMRSNFFADVEALGPFNYRNPKSDPSGIPLRNFRIELDGSGKVLIKYKVSVDAETLKDNVFLCPQDMPIQVFMIGTLFLRRSHYFALKYSQQVFDFLNQNPSFYSGLLMGLAHCERHFQKPPPSPLVLFAHIAASRPHVPVKSPAP